MHIPPWQIGNAGEQSLLPAHDGGQPSSTMPLQSLSMRSPQTSVVGVPGTQVFGEPPTHAGTVFWHAPVPQVMLPSPSSTMPLQLSSTPLQTSVAPGLIAFCVSSQSLPQGMAK